MKNNLSKLECTRQPPDREHCLACGRLWTEHTETARREGCKRQKAFAPILGRYYDLPLTDWAVGS